jgi:phosphonate transport system substrate-binding protein
VWIVLAACSGPDSSETEETSPSQVEAPGKTIRLGDIDPDTPARRTRRLQPLADYLAGQLGEVGVGKVQIVIARDMDEMASLLATGKVDLYLDSAFPTLMVQERAGSRLLLRRWAQGAEDYRTLFVTSVESELNSLEQLRGSVLALQEEYSTSGFLLPAGTLVQMGLELEMVTGPDERPTTDEVHYFFTRDEENTIELVNTGRVPAGAISNQEFQQLPAEMRDDLRVIGETRTVPRQLLSVRSDLDPAVIDAVTEVLVDLVGAEESPVNLENSPQGWTWKFDLLSAESQAGMDHLRDLAKELGIL